MKLFRKEMKLKAKESLSWQRMTIRISWRRHSSIELGVEESDGVGFRARAGPRASSASHGPRPLA